MESKNKKKRKGKRIGQGLQCIIIIQTHVLETSIRKGTRHKVDDVIMILHRRLCSVALLVPLLYPSTYV